MIRRATLDDADAIFHVHTSAIRHVAASHYTPEQIEAWAGELRPAAYREPIEHKVLLVAVDDAGGICGFGQLDAPNSVVEAVYVLPSHVRRGLGRGLLAALEAAAHASDVSALTLDASLNSVPFYSRAGYMPICAAEHRLKAGVSIPCMLMHKVLAHAAG
jgi:GNAT superfamily N-acetyltransferase